MCGGGGGEGGLDCGRGLRVVPLLHVNLKINLLMPELGCHLYTHTHTHIYICTRTYTHTHIYICTHTHICIYIYIYAHTHTHIMHTY